MARKKNYRKKNKPKRVQETPIEKKLFLADKPILLIILKSLVILIVFSVIIHHLDTKGYFDPDQKHNHTQRKWDSFYEFTEKNNVDILLMGNSHLYSGINPKNLSNTLGCNAFILASPGTNIADSYYGLKEALKRTDAKLVVIETYGINNFNPYKLKEGSLSDQFKSFYSRRDFRTKLTSMPLLFNSDNYLFAWSNTLRNHDFIFKDTTQLQLNKKLNKKRKKKKKKLYLGRFVRFQTGIEQETMAKYDSLGAAVKGNEYNYSEYAEKYVNKIVDLCQEKDVELIFLTVPMYEKHISDYEKWEEKIAEIIYPNKWINLQKGQGYRGFGTYAFENTYKSNQHMTYKGSLVATYKLAEYIIDSLQIELPNRKANKKWHKIFYGEEGYFENHNPSSNDQKNKIIASKKILRNAKLNSLLQLDMSNKKSNKLVAKIQRHLQQKMSYNDVKLRLVVKYEVNGKEQSANVDLIYDKFHKPKEEVIFSTLIQPIQIKSIIDGAIIKK